LLYWELGNEPDLYKTSAQGHVRPPTWTGCDYVSEWLNVTGKIGESMAQSCAEMAKSSECQYIAPSFAGTNNSLKPLTIWKDNLDAANDIALFSSHKYAISSQNGNTTNHIRLTSFTATLVALLNPESLYRALL